MTQRRDHHDDALHDREPDASGEPAAEPRLTSERRRTRLAGTRRASEALKARYAAARSPMEIFADRLTRFAASTPFLLFHIVWFAVWIAWNVGVRGRHPFDPFPFGLLTMIVSLEAIFLSIFVLLAQSRESHIAELREEITLQVILRAEEEITKTLQLVAGLYQRLELPLADDPELGEMLKPLDERRIERDLLKQIDETSGKSNAHGKTRGHAKGARARPSS
jgi:uncharacterized membrane protein